MFSVLVIEDHSDIREWLAALMQEAFNCAHIESVPTIEQACESVSKRAFDVALVDINLPDGSGIDFVRDMTNRFPSVYCVIATIYDDDKNLFASLRAGARGYLLKSQPRRVLLSQLQGIMRDEPPLSPSVARRMMSYFQREVENSNGANLTEREAAVLGYIARGMRRREISEMMSISTNTVAGHIKNIYRKLKISSQAEAALKASQLGLLDI